ncbi:TetR/AcrR family transcriptional regulator [Cumulibacter manganitolerans]|uniref:TetR/AcrR family transcriptional regulator n=1 Tax=Cumulibacter manganitolerans TaxID=1884992 RepID=UPI001296A1F9|nr:TetR/AcrR family transcriptional regulator [Cumulibacter manganitolerans]
MSTERDTGPRAARSEPGASSTPRGRMPRSERRRQLLDAAREVFVGSGYHQAAMDDIAERAGVSKPVLYQHFPGKLELYLALLDLHIEDLVTRIEHAMGGTTDNKERVRAAVDSYFDFVASGSQGYRLVFESDLRNDPQVGARVAAAQDACVESIARAVASDTDLGAERARLLSVGLVGLCVSSASAWLASREQISREEAISLMSALLWRGISTFPTSSTTTTA